MPPMSIEHRNTLHQIMRGPYMDMEVALVCEAIQNGLGGRIKVKKNNGGSLTFPHGRCRFLHRTTVSWGWHPDHGGGGKGKGKKRSAKGKDFRSDVVAALGRKLIEALGLDNVQGGFNLQKWNRICARNWNASYYSCSCKYARAGRTVGVAVPEEYLRAVPSPSASLSYPGLRGEREDRYGSLRVETKRIWTRRAFPFALDLAFSTLVILLGLV
ncbi:uncharacterized protein BXZ73DRAFT_105566 [Epithele typhae]|uniref:uncharacterized protein n=1 Tax=Epithele typhae TaxID=378194 RepID=UPI002007E138|nr:uncharacterized protein BXZ73DRAFT_105566 [Epithele typhae]KAH9917401.1 hypothetical protein BXZ73DRAFT_105566 [Epithele typhae]